MSNETTPGPQTWISEGKRITMTQCGPVTTVVTVCLKSGRVETQTFFKTTR